MPLVISVYKNYLHEAVQFGMYGTVEITSVE